jgi:hypothetical protein
VGNEARTGQGGGMRVRHDESPVVTNCIFWDNCVGNDCTTQDEDAQIHISGSGDGDSVTNCTIEGCDDPGFCAESGDNNKAVEPDFVDTGSHPYQLEPLTNGDLIDNGDGEDDSGNGCLSVNPTSLDLAGGDRFIRVDGECTAAADIVDIGAYEVDPS